MQTGLFARWYNFLESNNMVIEFLKQLAKEAEKSLRNNMRFIKKGMGVIW